jgi:hypothetical protein
MWTRYEANDDTANNLNLAAFWSNNVAAGASDVATWNHLVVNNLGLPFEWIHIFIRWRAEIFQIE